MEIKDVNDLLEKGFTPEQVLELAKHTNSLVTPPQPVVTPEPVKPSDNSEVLALQKELKELKEAIQSSNLKGAEIDVSKIPNKEASEILAEVFYGKKETK